METLWKKIQDTRNIVHRTVMPHSPPKQVPWDLTQFSQLPSAALSYFPESPQWSEISSLSKVILVLGKPRSHKAPNLGCRGVESPERFDVPPKILHKTCCVSWYIVLMKLSITSGFLNHLDSFHRGMFKLNTKFYTDSLLYSLSHFE